MPKSSEGDTISMTGEVTIVHDNGTATVHLRGYDIPVTTRAEHVALVAKRKQRRKQLHDEW